jgi:hypothetical protein
VGFSPPINHNKLWAKPPYKFEKK